MLEIIKLNFLMKAYVKMSKKLFLLLLISTNQFCLPLNKELKDHMILHIAAILSPLLVYKIYKKISQVNVEYHKGRLESLIGFNESLKNNSSMSFSVLNEMIKKEKNLLKLIELV